MAKKEWYNHRGQKVPAAYVPAFDKKVDRAVNSIVRKAKSLHDKIESFKRESLESCDKIYNEMLINADVEIKERKGNYTLTSFSKNLKIEVSVSQKIEFDEKINLAQEKIKEFVLAKSNGVDEDLLMLVNQAFETTKGSLDTKRVLALFSLKITAEKWQAAMTLIKDSMYTNETKRYMRIWEKDQEGKYKSIDLNFSSI